MKLNLKVNGKPYGGAKITKAAELVAFALGSKEFKEFVIDFSFVRTNCTGFLFWKKCKNIIFNRFHYTDMTNEGVYAKIISGAETLSPSTDGEIDIEVEVDHRYRRGVIGYTYPTLPTQYIYKSFLDSADVYDVAGNIAHEYIHKLGFGHEFKKTVDRENSVPYAVGYWVETFLRKKFI